MGGVADWLFYVEVVSMGCAEQGGETRSMFWESSSFEVEFVTSYV